jgi:hypothetical protein
LQKPLIVPPLDVTELLVHAIADNKDFLRVDFGIFLRAMTNA